LSLNVEADHVLIGEVVDRKMSMYVLPVSEDDTDGEDVKFRCQ